MFVDSESFGSGTVSFASSVRFSFIESVGMGSWGLGMSSLFSVISAGKSVPGSSGGALLVSGLFSSLVLLSAGLSFASEMELDSCGAGMGPSVLEFCGAFKSSLLVALVCGMESDSGIGMESFVYELCSAFGSPLTAGAGVEASSLSLWLLIDSFVADLDFSCDLDRLLLKGGGAV